MFDEEFSFEFLSSLDEDFLLSLCFFSYSAS
jgi:hypothetical protein